MLTRLIFLYRDSLFRNALYLMLATGVLAAFGFFFWLVSAHLVPTEAIGVATALVSVMNMIAVVSLVGFDTALIRFLSRSRAQNDILNTSIILVGAAALAFSGFFLIFADHISPQLALVLHNPYVALAFMAFCVTSALNILTDAAFIGYRQTVYSLAINILFSVVKVLLPLLFFGWGAFGIFSAAAAGQAIGFVLSWYVLVSRFGYRPRFTLSREVLSSVWKYSAGNYVSGVLNLLPLTLLPVIVINRLGATQAAYFYIVMTIASLLYVIPTAVTRSFFAEGSFDAENVSVHLRKSIRIIGFLLAPAIIILLLGGSYLLGFFGRGYSQMGADFLSLVTIAALVIAVYSTYGSLFRIKHNLEALILVNAVYAASILGLTYVFIRYGLVGVGIAWIAGNSLAALLSSAVYRLKPPHDLHRYWKGLSEKLDDLAAAIEIFITSKLLYTRVLFSRRFQRKFILFYPEKPKTYHVLYKICHALGYTITDDPRIPADAVIDFEDTTIRNPNLVFEALRKKRKVINIGCNDISKETVDRVFAEVFGYGISVDPLTYRGTCVKKSNTNALHDGAIVECPVAPEIGYVYQKLINNTVNDRSVMDIRVLIFNATIPFTIRRYRTIDDRFDKVREAVMSEATKDFSGEEIKKILQFTRKFGLDYGELDIVRDRDDGRIYIVDVNNTPAGPRGGRQISKEDYAVFFEKLTRAFVAEFLTHG